MANNHQLILHWAQYYASLHFIPMVIHPFQTKRSESGELYPVCMCGSESCKTAGKHPVIGWDQRPMKTPAQGMAIVQEILNFRQNRHKFFNLALRTGIEGGIFAIDVDEKPNGYSGKDNWKKFLRENEIDDPLHYETLQAQTGSGGWHFVYRYPRDGITLVKNAVNHPKFNKKLNPKDPEKSGVDVRGDGGLIIVAPSLHKSGNHYKWLTLEVGLKDPPEAILRAVSAQRKERDDGSDYSPTLEDLEAFALEMIKDKKRPERPQIGKDLQDVIRGKPIYVDSAAHEPFIKITWQVARKYPRASAAEIMELFKASIRERETLNPSGSCTHDDVFKLLKSALVKCRENADHWEQKLIRNQQGSVTPCLKNAENTLVNDPPWQGIFGMNKRSARPSVLKPIAGLKLGDEAAVRYPRSVMDVDDIYVAIRLSERHSVPFSVDDCRRAVQKVCAENTYDPFEDYLNNLRPWDGQRRVDTWLQVLGGAEDTPINRVFGAIFLLQAVKRTLEPGCQADYTLILEGEQGIGKSSLLRALVPDPSLFDDGLKPIDHTGNKDNLIKLGGPVILELAELGALRKGDVEVIKAFLTLREDIYRPPYGTHPLTMLRRCVFAGTTNSTNYLRDTTGNRRFMPVTLNQRVDIDLVRGVRDQLWAEALLRVRHGNLDRLVYIMTTELAEATKEAQDSRKTVEDWGDLVDKWLDEADKAIRNIKYLDLSTPDTVDTEPFDAPISGADTDPNAVLDLSHLDKYVEGGPQSSWDAEYVRRYGEIEHFSNEEFFEYLDITPDKRTKSHRESVNNHLRAMGYKQVKWKKIDTYRDKKRWLRKKR